MTVRCLTGVKFTMTATVLDYAPNPGAVDATIPGGHFETIQDEDTGAIQRVWVDDSAPVPTYNETEQVAIPRFDLPCYARGFTELGFRSSANTETYNNGDYTATEVIELSFPAQYSISRRQYITNIRDQNKRVLWLEEEIGEPTIFEVQGVTPKFDGFGRHMENIAVLRRASNQ